MKERFTIEVNKAKPHWKQIFRCVYVLPIMFKVIFSMSKGAYFDLLPGVGGRYYMKTDNYDLAIYLVDHFIKAGCETSIY